jgi:hypothetical protein
MTRKWTRVLPTGSYRYSGGEPAAHATRTSHTRRNCDTKIVTLHSRLHATVLLSKITHQPREERLSNATGNAKVSQTSGTAHGLPAASTWVMPIWWGALSGGTYSHTDSGHGPCLTVPGGANSDVCPRTFHAACVCTAFWPVGCPS